MLYFPEFSLEMLAEEVLQSMDETRFHDISKSDEVAIKSEILHQLIGLRVIEQTNRKGF